MVKFCNISKTIKFGIKPGDFILVEEDWAKRMANRVPQEMGKSFIILKEGQALSTPKQALPEVSVGADTEIVFKDKKKWPKK